MLDKNKHKLTEKLSYQTLLTKAYWPIENENMVNKNGRLKPNQKATPLVQHWSGAKLVAKSGNAYTKTHTKLITKLITSTK